MPGLSLVMITLHDENPFTIFETLNSTGQRLEEADLIRNHVFLQVPIGEQDAFDDDRWRPFEDSLLASDLYDEIRPTEFYRDFLMRQGKYVRKNGVYLAMQEAMRKEGFTPHTLVAELNRYVRYYRWIRSPETMPDPTIATELYRLSWLYLTTAYPLLLRLLALYDAGELPAQELAACLRAIQRFVIRRPVGRESTRPYSQFFPAAARDLDQPDALGSLRAILTKRGWPDDAAFEQALAAFPLYQREPSIARLLLIALEEQIGHKESVDVPALVEAKQLQLEHVMPQTLTAPWHEMLDGQATEDHRRLLHVLGNLTLSLPRLRGQITARRRNVATTTLPRR